MICVEKCLQILIVQGFGISRIEIYPVAGFYLNVHIVELVV